MQRFVVQRLLACIPVLLLVSFVSFAAIRMLPGDPALARLGEAWTAASAAQIRQQLGLDDPWYVQYARWISAVARGDLGKSMIGGESVGQALGSRVEVTSLLCLWALLFACSVGVPLGVISAVKQGSVIDYGLRSIAIAALAVPGFFLATLLLGYRPFGWTPPLGRYEPILANPSANLQLVLPPAILLGLGPSAAIMRMMRTTLLEVLRQDYIRTARAKGLAELRVIIGHAMRNAMMPVVTMLGLSMAALIGGSVIYESIFSLPGVGLYLLRSATMRDYTALQSVVLIYAVAVVLINFGVDVFYLVLDPRLRAR